MPTDEESSNRRWMVVKGVLFFMGSYTALLIGLYIYGFAIKELDMMTGLIYGGGTFGLLRNWLNSRSIEEKDD
jgi:hypothetical protein